MYDELVKNLRSVKDSWQTEEEQWMLDAADAIETLCNMVQSGQMETDYISRDEARQAVVYAIELYPWEYEAITKEINAIHSANVEPVLRAYWEEVDSEVANLTHKCSHCENEAHLDEFGEELLTEYCPECGARMWEDEN